MPNKYNNASHQNELGGALLNFLPSMIAEHSAIYSLLGVSYRLNAALPSTSFWIAQVKRLSSLHRLFLQILLDLVNRVFLQP